MQYQIKYRIIITERKQIEPKRTKLKSLLGINDVVYWQNRITKLTNDLNLDEYVTAAVA